MSLAGSGQVNHPVTKRGVDFLLASARDDGSWPIDTNLATWVTTLAVNALASGSASDSNAVSGGLPETLFTIEDGGRIRDWLLKQQYRKAHPYTHAAPGGWAWTDLPGGVPDADDTAGALLALKKLLPGNAAPNGNQTHNTPHPSDEGRGLGGGRIHSVDDDHTLRAAVAGVNWLLNLQNSDGGIPTFCRGWTNLPFDRSAPDLTAHALRAWNAWLPEFPERLQRFVRRGMEKGLRYLARTQRPDGAWLPLWFGNQHTPDETNPIYGTARVVIALAEIVGQASRLPRLNFRRRTENSQAAAENHSRFLDASETPALLSIMAARGAEWLRSVQKSDGSWGAPGDDPSSIEETALAVEALAGVAEWNSGPATGRPSRADGRDAVPASASLDTRSAREAAMRGATWLMEKVESSEWKQPSPIGFYFAKLWYYERLYPQIFTLGALTRIVEIT